MSDVPPTSAHLRCWICLRTFRAYRNLVCHRIRKHRTLLSGSEVRSPAARAWVGVRSYGGTTGAGLGVGRSGAGGDGESADRSGVGASNTAGDPDDREEEEASEGGADGGAGKVGAVNAVDLHVSSAGSGVGPAHDGGAAPNSGPIKIKFKKTIIEDAMAAMDTMVQLTRQPVLPPPRHKRTVGRVNGTPTDDTNAPAPQEYKYTTVTSEVRSFYEDKQDWSRAEPLLKRRRTGKPGRFNSVRLRALQTYALTGRPGGFSLSEQ